MATYDKECINCRIRFVAKRNRRQFCSQKCGDAHRHRNSYVSRKPIKGYDSKCNASGCNKIVHYFPRDIKSGRKRHCNAECMGVAKLGNMPLKCSECNKSFYCSKSQQELRNRNTCSRVCAGLKRTRLAELNNRLNPPTQGKLNRRIRYSKKMQEWRIAVFERDNYTCQHCGARNGNGYKVTLNADHIKPFALFPESRFDTDNGQTLCLPCHKETPTYGRKALTYDS